VASNNARIFGTPRHAPGKSFKRATLEQKISAVQPSGFGKFGGGEFGFASEGTGRSKRAVVERCGGHGVPPFFEPDDRLLGARLQLVHSPNQEVPPLGDKIRLIPGHCDPTVNLYDWYVGIRGNRVEQLWPITARGAV
jgi:D-serine deaminase-like pyridoxal phosphate-dependent protein